MYAAIFIKRGATEFEGAEIYPSLDAIRENYGFVGFEGAELQADGLPIKITADGPRSGQTIIVLPVDTRSHEEVMRKKWAAGWRPTLAVDENLPKLPGTDAWPLDQRVPLPRDAGRLAHLTEGAATAMRADRPKPKNRLEPDERVPWYPVGGSSGIAFD